jgi:hypothetical protein
MTIQEGRTSVRRDFSWQTPQALLAGVYYNEQPQARARQLIAISTSHPTARQAYLSRKHLVEDAIVEPFASRARSARRNDLRVRLLAGITLAMMNATIGAWFLGEEKILEAAAKHVEAELQKITLNTAPVNSKKRDRGKEVEQR